MGKAKYKKRCHTGRNTQSRQYYCKYGRTNCSGFQESHATTIATNTNHQLISIMFDKPICHIKLPYLLPEITQKYLMYGKTLQEVPFTF